MSQENQGVRWVFAGVMVATICGCTQDGMNSKDGGDGVDAGVTYVLKLVPEEITLTVVDNAVAKSSFQATAVDSNGKATEVSNECEWFVDDLTLASFVAGELKATGLPGTTSIGCRWRSLVQKSKVTVKVEKSRVVAGAPSNAAALFKAAADDASRVVRIVYPLEGTAFPPNTGDIEAHWVDTSAGDLVEVTLRGALFVVSVYSKTTTPTGDWLSMVAGTQDWRIFASGGRGSTMQLSVRTLKSSDPAKSAKASISVSLTRNNLLGGIYYWSPSPPAGIYRHDFAQPEAPPELYYDNSKFPPEVPKADGCVGCHAVAPSGDRVAFDYQTPVDPHRGAVVNTGTRMNLFAPTVSTKWILPTFEPSGRRMITTSFTNVGQLSLRDAQTGQLLGTVPTSGYASHPDFSPSGNAIAYTLSAKAAQLDEAQVVEGAIVVQEFDRVAGTFGAARTLVPYTAPHNNYYPNWSPDGKWIVFNRSTANSYHQPSAQLYAVPSDGSRAPVLLAAANVASGLTNSWPKFAPFVDKTADGRTIAWLTFSSTRPFGVRATGGAQLWMTSFDVERAGRGEDPSSPAFRIPFQTISASNHSAQWTQKIIDIN